jgi:hypothetical protein
MGERRTFLYTAIDSQPLSANYTSDWTDVIGKERMHAYIEWIGANAANVGALTLEYSPDKTMIFSATGSIPIDTTAAGKHSLISAELNYKFIRFKYTNTSHATGTITVKVSGATV